MKNWTSLIVAISSLVSEISAQISRYNRLCGAFTLETGCIPYRPPFHFSWLTKSIKRDRLFLSADSGSMVAAVLVYRWITDYSSKIVSNLRVTTYCMVYYLLIAPSFPCFRIEFGSVVLGYRSLEKLSCSFNLWILHRVLFQKNANPRERHTMNVGQIEVCHRLRKRWKQ